MFSKYTSCSRFSLFAIILLTTCLGPATARAAVTAYQIDSSGGPFFGDYADGRIDDYILENDVIAVLISDIPHTGYYTVSGGNILDAGSTADWIDALAELYTYFDDTWPRQADYSTIEITDDGSGGGQAAIRVTGVDSNDASLTVVTDYILNDGAEYVTIVTMIANTGGSTYDMFEMGDGFHWGACDKYIPGQGFAHTDTTHEPWIAATGETVSYGYTSPPTIMWGDHGGYWSDLNVFVENLNPGDSTGYMRAFIVGGQDVASVAAIAHQIWGTPTGAVACTVSSQAGGGPIAGAKIDVYDSLDAPYLQMEIGDGGEGFTTLPAGDWRLAATAFGYHSQETWLAMTAGDPFSYHFFLEPDTTVPAKGDTLAIECLADSTTTGWTAQLQYELIQVPLTILSSSYDATTLWWTLQTQIPTVPPVSYTHLTLPTN